MIHTTLNHLTNDELYSLATADGHSPLATELAKRLAAQDGVLQQELDHAEREIEILRDQIRFMFIDEGDVSDEALRTLWRKHGGSFHGPVVEHGIMPEDTLLKFLRLAIRTDEVLEQLGCPRGM